MKEQIKSRTMLSIIIFCLALFVGAVFCNNDVNAEEKADTVQKKNLKSLIPNIKVSNCTYTGRRVKPKVCLMPGKTELKEGVDYKASYKNNKRVGRATIKMMGCGKYFGTIKKTFIIKPKGTALKKCRSKKKQIKVRWKKQNKKCNGYQIRYSTKMNFKKSKFRTIKGKKRAACTLKKLKAGTRYYIQVRVFYKAGKKKYYSDWSIAKSVKTKWGIYHTEKRKTRYQSIPPFNVKVSIKGNKLFVKGKLQKTVNGKKYVRVSGLNHIFVLTTKTRYWMGYFNDEAGAYTKEMFLNEAKEAIGEKEIILSVDIKNGTVYETGTAPFTKEWKYSFL